jgi:endonuclease/exonuclease/phosphatase (EEP) superfamily protein YafD
MTLFRLLAGASATEFSLVAAAASVLGLLGARSGTLDVINSFAPFTFLAAFTGATLALAALEPGSTRTVTLVLALIGGVSSAVLIAPEVANWQPAAKNQGAPFRILTANVWRDNPSPDLAAAAILALDADAVMLQEAAGSLSGQMPRLKAAYPYSCDCGRSDEVILAKSPIVAHTCGLGRGLSGDLVSVTIATPDKRTLTLVTLHLSHPFPAPPQDEERLAVAARVRALGAADIILSGDFNSTPWSFALKRLDASLAPLRRRTIAWFTWPARLDDLSLAWPIPVLPIDHIYASPNWDLVRMTRVRIPGSDHFGTEAMLVRAPGSQAAE